MSTHDPTSVQVSWAVSDHEWTVDEVAAVLNSEREAPETEARIPAIPKIPEKLPLPIRPRNRFVSGTYRTCPTGVQLVLRVDVDGKRPMKRLSGDFFIYSGKTSSYYGSFVVDSPTISVSSSTVTITGMGSYTWSAGAPIIKVTIARHTVFQPAANAHVQFYTSSKQKGASYTCGFSSSYFREVSYEQDYVEGVTPFPKHDTSTLPSGGTDRVLGVAESYAEAGVQMVTSGSWNKVPANDAGVNALWSNAELHAAMVKQFSLWKDDPQWKVWMLAAGQHEYGAGLYGIMFDQTGKQRQGCAVFHEGVGGDSAEQLRLQLYTYVHELGHCFNLFHSFHKTYMDPPLPNRLDSLSWMNYPWNFPGGHNKFWSDFAFQFDDPEVIHLRHAFRNNIIIGGNPFGQGAALEAGHGFEDSITDDSGLQLRLSTKPTVLLGEPVMLDFELSLSDGRTRTVHTALNPDLGAVQLLIERPGGALTAYEPFLHHFVAASATTLTPAKPAITDSAYVGYSRNGLVFDQVGRYRLRAVYVAPDGSRVLSNALPLFVRAPYDAMETDLSGLFLMDDVGALLALKGSDSDTLKDGNEALDAAIATHPVHQMSRYAAAVKGVNASRSFKRFTADGLTLRLPDYAAVEAALTTLTGAVDAAGARQTNAFLSAAEAQLSTALDNKDN